MKNVNENIYTSIRNGGTTIRVGTSNHYFIRENERYWGMDLPTFVKLLDNCITYNPDYDELPTNISKDCIRSIRDKQLKYNCPHCFKLIPSEDMVVVICKRDWITNRENGFTPKPYYFNEWVVVTMWKCSGEGVLISEPKQPKLPIRVNGRIIGWY